MAVGVDFKSTVPEDRTVVWPRWIRQVDSLLCGVKLSQELPNDVKSSRARNGLCGNILLGERGGGEGEGRY